jgi:hypothetical protein
MMKTQRNLAEEATARQTLGLFALANGERSVPLPLKSIDARFEACGDCASVVLEQIFEFEGPNPVDVLYTFPLPENASVHDCELRVGSRSVKAKIKPLEDAREDYRKAKAAGHRAALVETVRDNLFELHLGNVQPGDEILIRLSFIVPLSGESAQRRRLRIPTCPGVRYIPGRPVGADGGTDLVPDAGRLNPLRIASNDPEAAVFYCAGTIVGGSNIESPSHEIEILPPTPDGRMAVMSIDESDSPDRDFILTWEPLGIPLALMGPANPDYLLCSIHAPADLPGERGARDIFFLLDSSGSMEGPNWSALVEAFELALAGLAVHDRVSVDLFNNRLQPVSDGLLAAHSPQALQLPARLRNHDPSGGTEFTGAFDATIAKAREARRPVIIVITDGQFGDEARACAIAAACDIEVHMIGIDANVNETALQKIARRTRGTCSLCVPGEDLDVTIQQLIANLLSPSIERITASDGWKPVGNLPALRPGQAALVPFSHPSCDTPLGQAAASVDLKLKFTDGSMRVIHLPIRTAAGQAPALLAAKAAITALLDDGKDREAVATACRHNLLCEGVAFVAWDEAEQVAIANTLLEQPAMAVGEDVCYMAASHAFSPPYGAPSQSQLPRSFRAPDLMSPCCFKLAIGTNRADQWLQDHPEPVPLFDPLRWTKLLGETLVPWALVQEKNMKILVRFLRKLESLGANMKKHPKAMTILREMIPFVPPSVAQAIEDFCQAEETGLATRQP